MACRSPGLGTAGDFGFLEQGDWEGCLRRGQPENSGKKPHQPHISSCNHGVLATSRRQSTAIRR